MRISQMKWWLQDLLAEYGEAIRRSFKEEMPKDKYINFYSEEEGYEVSLCRATRWNRVGGGQQMEGEGVEPWRVILQIITYELEDD
jgi:hypothetical protein